MSDAVERALERCRNAKANGEPARYLAGLTVADAVALSAEIERLRAALKPFADCCDFIDADEDDEEWAKFRLLIKNYRAARLALAPLEGDKR